MEYQSFYSWLLNVGILQTQQLNRLKTIKYDF